MLTRHISAPFALRCYTDRPRDINADIRQIDSSGWGLTGTHSKLKLFDGDTVPFDHFLYMDIKLIVLKDVMPMVECARGKTLTALRDWHYDCLNSCVMWVEKSDVTQAIWDQFNNGVKYQVVLGGDQDYINAVIRDQGFEDRVGYFPQEWIASYKNLLRLNRKSPAEARAKVDDAFILKFHGNPHPHQLMSTLTRMRHLSLKFPGHAFADWCFLRKEIAEWWQ